MSQSVRDIIDACRDKALGCTDLTREELIALISIDPESKDCDYLGRTARDVKAHFSGNVARLGTSTTIFLGNDDTIRKDTEDDDGCRQMP